ncbi:MAG: hypothetical protein RR623_09880 [Bacilli bacterium]
MNIDIIKDILNETVQLKDNLELFVIANVSNTIQSNENMIVHSDPSEFFTKAEFAGIISSITYNFPYVRIFYSETEFMKYFFDNPKINVSNSLVFNFARDGVSEGKKSLVPAFCSLYSLKYTGSNPFVISLLRNKYVYTKFLESQMISVPRSMIYLLNNNNDFIFNNGTKIIVKNIYESASIGMNDENILVFNESEIFNNKLETICKSLNSKSILIQEYIPGLECEVFVINYNNEYYAFQPILIKINGSEILTNSISNTYDYSFDLLSNHVNNNVCNEIMEETVSAAKKLGIKDYARFDYRIFNDNIYLIDIAGTPYLTMHSSINYLFTYYLNLKYTDIFLLLVGVCYFNYSNKVNCKSDNNNALDS